MGTGGAGIEATVDVLLKFDVLDVYRACFPVGCWTVAKWEGPFEVASTAAMFSLQKFAFFRV